jgi:lipoprotein-anchoring transpeptidase ErfK/SrfK
MKLKRIFLTLIVLAAVAGVGVKASSVQKTIANVNADANKPGGPEQVLKSISASTHVPVATLEKQKAKSGLSYGDLFIAHSIAKASGKSFEEIAAMKTKGQTWDKIAEDNNVSLDGKKVVKKVAAKPNPTPPKKTLRQEQAERYSGKSN